MLIAYMVVASKNKSPIVTLRNPVRFTINLDGGDGAHVDPDHEREQVAGQEAGRCRDEDNRMPVCFCYIRGVIIYSMPQRL